MTKRRIENDIERLKEQTGSESDEDPLADVELDFEDEVTDADIVIDFDNVDT